MRERFKLKFDDESTIICYKWSNPDNLSPKGVVQIAHGLSEHVTRYDDFANFLVKEGFIVLGADHYNHGESANSPEEVGIIEKYDFITAVCKTIKLVRTHFNQFYQGITCLFGHSMGSIATQTYIQKYPNDFNHVILSGTDVGDIKYAFLRLLTSITVKKGDFKTSTKLVYGLTFGNFSKKFRERGKFNWLSANSKNVDAYELDPLCGAPVSDSVYKSISIALRGSFKTKNIKLINKDVRIFIFSGNDDPVSGMGKSVTKLYKKYNKENLDVDMKLYKGLRHEVLNELEKDLIYNDILKFLLNKA